MIREELEEISKQANERARWAKDALWLRACADTAASADVRNKGDINIQLLPQGGIFYIDDPVIKDLIQCLLVIHYRLKAEGLEAKLTQK
ncbi:MAG: hypothetical protein V2A79_09960 [Planctomycetota bacterium]